MAHEGREPVEPRLSVDAVPVPAQQARHREGVAQGMEVWRAHTVGDRKSELDDETVERLACGARVHRTPAVEAEQRVVLLRATALDVASEELADTRPVRNEAVLAELPTPYDEELALRVHVADAESARLPGPQAEAVAEAEDRVVGRPTAGRPRVVGKSGGGVEQLTNLSSVEEEGQALFRLPSLGLAQRRRVPGAAGRRPSRGNSRGSRQGG